MSNMHEPLKDGELARLFVLAPIEGGLVEPVKPNGRRRLRDVKFRITDPPQRREDQPLVFNTSNNGNVSAQNRQIVGGHPSRVARVEQLRGAYGPPGVPNEGVECVPQFEADYNPVKMATWLLSLPYEEGSPLDAFRNG